MNRVPVRGQVFMATFNEMRKPWLVVSNNARNERLPECLAVRITTSPKPELDSIVELDTSDPLTGRVLCDDIGPLWRDELDELVGALTPRTMIRVEAGLKAALALR